MKPDNDNSQTIGKTCAVILFGALALATTIACSDGPKTAKASMRPAIPSNNAAVVRTATVESPKLAADAEKESAVERPVSNLHTFKSRDYGVSFQYPWQYAFLNARTIANSDEALQPKSDGTEGQFTLARIDVPNGYYPDTNFDSGYFTLSLNQDLEEESCYATLGEKDKLKTTNINGVDFRWMESESGGHGSAAKIRNYVAYTNGTCYEIEAGVKTQNEKGLAREVNPDQVMSRLERILQTVVFASDANKSVEPIQSSAQVQPVAQN